MSRSPQSNTIKKQGSMLKYDSIIQYPIFIFFAPESLPPSLEFTGDFKATINKNPKAPQKRRCTLI
jgi:hypothetical protein